MNAMFRKDVSDFDLRISAFGLRNYPLTRELSAVFPSPRRWRRAPDRARYHRATDTFAEVHQQKILIRRHGGMMSQPQGSLLLDQQHRHRPNLAHQLRQVHLLRPM